MKIPSLLYRVCWLLFSSKAGKTKEDRRDLIVLAGLGLVLVAALTHTMG